ncbi:MAG: bifunctional DNA-formamidopyrimidine glycosylase/DNA-(apurinic or apyrimidinic site) lyase [Gemmatimonadaceae bacterium]
MPELPETETYARDLTKLVGGATIRGVRVRRPNVLRRAGPTKLAKRLTGTRIVRVWRRAKHIIFEMASGDRLIVQPRFTGVLFVTQGYPKDAKEQYVTVSLELGDKRFLHYADVRRLGTVSLFSAKEFAAFVARLGLEPLETDFTNARLAGVLRGSRQAIKKVVMDQSRVAGVGNIYAAEALWRAQIDPSRAASTIKPGEVDRLREAIVEVLAEAVEARGTSIRDYRDANGAEGKYAHHLRAYGRGSQPCLRCGTRLASTTAIDGRATVFCWRCQR